MFLFRNKKNEEDEHLKTVTENLYKQNLELAVKNRTLSLLAKLYEISILTLSPEELSKRITAVIQEDFSFELVGIFLYNDACDTLKPLAVAESSRLLDIQNKFKINIGSIDITGISNAPFFMKIRTDKIMQHTENIADVWDSLIPSVVVEKIKKDGHIRSSVAYPLIIENDIIGMFILSLNRTYEDLYDYEKDSIKSFINVIAAAIDKAILYEKLEDANHSLEVANTEQSSLIHFITHQVKGFLTKSKFIFSLMREGDYGEISDKLKSAVEEGYNSDIKGVAMVQDILNAANFKQGTVAMNPQDMDFKTLVLEVTDELKGNASTKGLSLELKASDESFKIKGDKVQLKQAIKNLVDNSIKYTPTGSINITLERNKEGIIKMKIEDTGVGISPEDMANLFKEGGRGKDSVKVNVESTGYGLFIVKKIIEAHAGGHVIAESDGVGKGSRFTVELQGI